MPRLFTHPSSVMAHLMHFLFVKSCSFLRRALPSLDRLNSAVGRCVTSDHVDSVSWIAAIHRWCALLFLFRVEGMVDLTFFFNVALLFGFVTAQSIVVC